MNTFQAIAVTGLAVLPGALYTWSLERELGNWGVSLSDRLLRFVGFSAMFHAVSSVPEYVVWSRYLHRPVDGLGSGILLSWEDVHFLEVFPQGEGGPMMAKDQSTSGARILRGSKATRGGYSGSALKQAPKRPSSPGAGTPASSASDGTGKSSK